MQSPAGWLVKIKTNILQNFIFGEVLDERERDPIFPKIIWKKSPHLDLFTLDDDVDTESLIKYHLVSVMPE